MGENFQKIKKKSLHGAIIKSVVCGVSFGLFAVGAILLTLKLVGIPLAFYYYLLIGLGGALLCGGLAFLLFKPSDVKLAKKLDKEYGLKEKLQTALVYANEQGAVVEMQRADADERLAPIAHEKFNLTKWLPRIWQFIVVVVLAIAIAVTSFAVPAKYAQGGTNGGGGEGEQQIPFKLTDEILDGLDQLIAEVKETDIEDNLKSTIASLLQRLEDNLFTAQYVSEVNALLASTVSGINKAVDESYSYVTIANALNNFDNYYLAVTIADAARVYRTFRFGEFDDLGAYAEQCHDEIAEQITSGMEYFYDSLGEDAGDVPALIITALTASKVSTSDKLYQLFMTFARGLASADGPNRVQFALNLEDEIARQTYIRATRVFVFNVLGAIFDYRMPSDPDLVIENKQPEDGDEDKTNQGGYGSGDWKNNVQVYDPRTGEYGNYMDILEDYYALVDEMLRSGELTEEQQKIIEAYFQILFSGNTAESEE